MYEHFLTWLTFDVSCREWHFLSWMTFPIVMTFTNRGWRFTRPWQWYTSGQFWELNDTTQNIHLFLYKIYHFIRLRSEMELIVKSKILTIQSFILSKLSNKCKWRIYFWSIFWPNFIIWLYEASFSIRPNVTHVEPYYPVEYALIISGEQSYIDVNDEHQFFRLIWFYYKLLKGCY